MNGRLWGEIDFYCALIIVSRGERSYGENRSSNKKVFKFRAI